MIKGNISENLRLSNKEIFENIFKNSFVKIERIISNGQKTPDNFWYDQDEYEFVMVTKGKALLEIQNKTITLKEHDYVIIEPHAKHRVLFTEKPTVWLCIFFK